MREAGGLVVCRLACVCRVLSPCRGIERVVRQSGSSQGQGQRANQDFFSGLVSFVLFSRGSVFFSSGAPASLLQEV